MLRSFFRWSLFVLFVVAGLIFLNDAIFNAWASDVPPRLYSEIYIQRANKFGLISIVMFFLSGVSVWLLRPKKNRKEEMAQKEISNAPQAVINGNESPANTFHEDVRLLIGEDLRVIGATHIHDIRSGNGFDETEVCFFSVSNKIVAISYSPRDGAACFIGDAGSPELSQYETWEVLWHVLGMDKDLNFDFPETVTEYLDMFPKGYEGLIKFIGKCLVRYFGGTR